MKTRSTFTLILLALLVAACAAPTPTPATPVAVENTAVPTEATPFEMVTLKMNFSNQISYAPILIAEAEGYFSEYGITMEHVPFDKSSKAVALLVSGDLDVFAGAVNVGILNTVAQDENVRVVADRGHIAPEDSCTYQAILVRKDLFESGKVTGPADLVGRTFSLSTGSSSSYIFSTYLAQAGLTLDDINMVDLPTPAELDAYENKSIDGTTAPEPNLTMTLNAGNAVILARSQDVIGTLQSGMVAFGKNLLVDHPDIGVRFLAAYLKGVQKYNEGKTERNIQIIADGTGTDPELLKAACWVSIRMDGMVDFAGVDGFQKWAIDQGLLDAAVTEEQFWDPSMLAQAQKLLAP
ncbi:MAG: ABC transporter substrate-binding protein [Chloroflexi bacterium]|nr:ABC transporter substrate-binding protein [Chloroflexota bacterium]